MARVVHFEISSMNPERSVDFYRKVFDWQIDKWEGPQDYWLIATGPEDKPGINGAIFVPRDPFVGTVNTIEIESLDEFMEKVKSSGGEVVTEKMTIPGIGYLAYCKDPEGVLFGLIQNDSEAK